MAELQHLVESHQTNGGGGGGSSSFIPPPVTTILEATPETSAGVGSKRLRRPSVRLGDIGGGGTDQYQPVYDSQIRRSKWRQTASSKVNNQNPQKSSSRTRTLTNLSSGYDNTGTGEEDPIAVGSWRVKNWVKSSDTTATTKRARTNWAASTKLDGTEGEEEEEEEDEEGFRDFSREDSESPIKEQSQSQRRRYENEDWHRGGREGVKIWLQELGLGRYWPMFEMHEVDEEALPLLTLEDLKDMGINAVGSRRKMFCAIQKLGREFS